MRQQQQAWEDAQIWERDWWLNNPEQYRAEIKKGDIVAAWMGIRNMPTAAVVDIGCGPFSLLQRVSVRAGYAVDPNDYGPLEIGYKIAGVNRVLCRGEEMVSHLPAEQFDEAWIYNCLQHVEDPAAVINQAIQCAKRVRIFEWINIPPYPGHLHMLTAQSLAQPFALARCHVDFSFIGQADFDGLNGEFYVGVFQKTPV